MFDQSNQPEKTELEKAIDDAFRELNSHDAHSGEYKTIVDQLSKLYALQEKVENFNLKQTEIRKQSENTEAEAELRLAEARLRDAEAHEKLKAIDQRFWERVNPDTVLLVAGNLLGIGLVLGYERGHVMVTKAFNYVLKPR